MVKKWWILPAKMVDFTSQSVDFAKENGDFDCKKMLDFATCETSLSLDHALLVEFQILHLYTAPSHGT
jgi:hypothetical protein